MTTSVTGPETLAVPQPAPRSRRTRWFLWGGILVLTLALGFAVGFVTSQMTHDEPTGLANAATVKLIDDNINAYKSMDPDAFAATYAHDAVISTVYRAGWCGWNSPRDRYCPAQVVNERATLLANGFDPTLGFGLTSALAEHNGLVSATFSESHGRRGVVVYEIGDGKIQHQWIVMWGQMVVRQGK